jgi:CheY-like chemotaxis protein
MGTVLFVDDNVDTRNVMSRMLSRSGNRVIPAGSVTAAEELLTDETPDLILTDLMMPHGNGVDLIRHIRSDERFDDVPIIVFSAVSERRYVDQAMDAGATDYWLKGSVHARDFARKLQPYLPGGEGWADAWPHPLPSEQI